MGRASWFRVAVAGALAGAAPVAHAQRLSELRPVVTPAVARASGVRCVAWRGAAPDTTPPARPTQPGDRRAAHAGRGALIGAALGIGFALYMDAHRAEPGARTSTGRQRGAAVAVCGALGAAVGGLVGVVIP